jgi:predicted RNA-binding protein with RPS1 domain
MNLEMLKVICDDDNLFYFYVDMLGGNRKEMQLEFDLSEAGLRHKIEQGKKQYMKNIKEVIMVKQTYNLTILAIINYMKENKSKEQQEKIIKKETQTQTKFLTEFKNYIATSWRVSGLDDNSQREQTELDLKMASNEIKSIFYTDLLEQHLK